MLTTFTHSRTGTRAIYMRPLTIKFNWYQGGTKRRRRQSLLAAQNWLGNSSNVTTTHSARYRSRQDAIGISSRRRIVTSIEKSVLHEQNLYQIVLFRSSSSSARVETEAANPSLRETNSGTVFTTTDVDDEDLMGRDQRKKLLDAINHIFKKQKHFWTIDELNLQTQRLVEYCNDRDDGTDNTAMLKRNIKAAVGGGSGSGRTNNRNINKPTSSYSRYGRPSSNTFFQVLEAWMERSMMMADQPGGGTMDCAERARLVLDAMLPKREMYQPHTTGITNQDGTRYIQNSKLAFLQYLLQTAHYEVVLQAYAVSNAGLPAAIRAESLLSQMIQRCKLHMKKATAMIQRTSYDPNKMRGGTQKPTKRRILTTSNKHDRSPVPTLKTFNIVLNCWAKSNAYEAADRVNALLTLMIDWHDTYNNYTKENKAPYQYVGCLPNERSLLCLIEAWTNGRPNEAPEVTLRLLQEVMIATDQRNNETKLMVSTLHPDNIGISANNSSSNNGGRMDRRYRNVQLDEAVFNAVIYAWVRSNRGRSAAIQAEDILQMMIQWSQTSSSSSGGVSSRVRPVQPTTRTYSMIIMAWAECETIESKGDAAQRAETILMKMVQLFSEGQDSVKPNSLLFTSCIAAWSRAALNCNEAPDRAERLWELLRKLYAETGCRDIELEPSTQIGNAVISAWSRCVSRSDSVERALGALDILKQEGKDDLISYNTVLDAMSKKGCAQDAIKLLHWLEGPDSNRSLVPDLVSYNSVLAAFGRSSTTALTKEDKDSGSKSCNADEAETLLRRMEQMNGLKPDKLSYTSVMNAWSRSDNPQKTHRASALLRDMIRQYENGDYNLKPDVYVYTTLIKTCAYSRGSTKQENLQALQMALNAMATLENTDYGPPNDVTYATIMTAIYRLSGDRSHDHDSHYEAAFRRCAARGLLTKDVMQVFQRGASIRLFRRLTNNTGRLQPEWSRNVPDHKKPGGY